MTRSARSLAVLDRRIRRHDDDQRLGGQPGDRRGLGQVDRRLVEQDGADHDEAVDHQLVSVALGADQLGEADRAAGAGDVGDLHALGDAGRGQRLLHRAGRAVPAAAGRGRSHDLQFHLGEGGRGQAGEGDGGHGPALEEGREHSYLPKGAFDAPIIDTRLWHRIGPRINCARLHNHKSRCFASKLRERTKIRREVAGDVAEGRKSSQRRSGSGTGSHDAAPPRRGIPHRVSRSA